MNICNCHQDLDALLCDIPKEWREGIVNALCFILQCEEVECSDITKCQTLTTLSPFTLSGNILSITYKNEKGQIKTRSIDITPAFESILDDIDPLCLTDTETWAEMTHEERMEMIAEAMCVCCPPTTTTTTTTTSTSTTTTTTVAPDCMSFQVTADEETELSYTDCTGAPQNEVFAVGVHQFCAYSGSVSIISGSPVIEIIDVCTGGTTSTTTTSSTTTTTANPFDYYLADQRSCDDCGVVDVSNVVVRFFAGTGVNIGDFHITDPYDGNSYEILSPTTPDTSVDLTDSLHNTTCESVCPPTTTTTTSTTTTTTLCPDVVDIIAVSGSGISTTTTTTLTPPVGITGTLRYTCSDNGCTNQGLTTLYFVFDNPTPAALDFEFGFILDYVLVPQSRGMGYDIYTLPGGVVPNTYYNPDPSLVFNTTVSAGITIVTINNALLTRVGGGNPWICQTCDFPMTNLYVKITTPGYFSNLTIHPDNSAITTLFNV